MISLISSARKTGYRHEVSLESWCEMRDQVMKTKNVGPRLANAYLDKFFYMADVEDYG